VIEEVHLKKWEDIHKIHKKLQQDSTWLYRGQREASWALMTSLERAARRNNVSNLLQLEIDLFREFRRHYHQYATHIPQDKFRVEWSAIMQHYGSPTRLLDFTYSIYVAAYFALEYAEGDSAVYAINGRWANLTAAKLLSSHRKNANAVKNLKIRYQDAEEYEKDTTHLVWDKPLVCAALPVNPFHRHERLSIQHGIFLVPCDVRKSFMENLTALGDPGESALKIIIPKTMREGALWDLFNMHTTRKSLFPGLDGFAESLGVYGAPYRPDPMRLGTKPAR
jgi:hypothetical protein